MVPISHSDEFTDWAEDVERAAGAVDVSKEEAKWEKTSIYRVPKFIKSEKMAAFVPHVVSFGPFHHGCKDLILLEEHKHHALCHFLHRSAKPLWLFADRLRSALDELMESYNGLDNYWKENPDEFVKVMLLDGCFMIETLRRLKDENGYAFNDPVFGLQKVHSRMPYIKRDMLLLENQLPLLVLKLLLEAEGRGSTDDQYINNLVLKFCGRSLENGLQALGRHPLEVYRASLLKKRASLGRSSSSSTVRKLITKMSPIQKYVFPLKGNRREDPRDDIRPATALHECGVHFLVNKDKNLMEIEFDCKSGNLNVPVLPINDATEHYLLNMIVYEHMHVGVGKEITCFVVFMDQLIKTADDVKLLQEKGIIRNELGSHKAVAKLFNSLAKEVSPDPTSQLIGIGYQLNVYCMKSRNKWFATLRHTHFHSPWAMLSLVAAILVILLTLIQACYAVVAYHLPPKQRN